MSLVSCGRSLVVQTRVGKGRTTVMSCKSSYFKFLIGNFNIYLFDLGDS